MSRDFLEMGTLGRAHGIKGEIGVYWYGESAPAIKTPIFLRNSCGDLVEYRLTSARMHNGRLLIGLSGVADRNQAEELRGATVLMPRQYLPRPGSDEAYLEDLPGCRVYLSNGQSLGIIDHLEFPAGQDLWVISEPGEEDVLFPARPEFIRSFNIAERSVVIDPPAGLVEIYRA